MADVTDEVPISHLQRRRIESRVLIPFIAACREKFGDAATNELVVATIRSLAVEDGARWGEAFGRDMHALKNVAETVWAGGGSLDIDMVAAGDDRLDFNVTRCRYAEFYKDLGLPDLGYLVHCNRDHARRLQSGPETHTHANRDGRRQPLRLPLHEEIIEHDPEKWIPVFG